MTPTTLIIIAAIGLAIARQFQARELRVAPLVMIPVILISLGIPTLAAAAPTTTFGIALFLASVPVSIGLGVLRGRSEHVWHATDGKAWRRATVTTGLFWAASIATRLVAVVLARLAGDHSSMSAQIELLLGLSFAAQHLVLASRAGLIGRIFTLAIARD